MEKEKIWLSSPHMGGDEIKYVQEAFDTNWISPVGPNLVAFEKELAAYCKVEESAVLSSGTAALHLALVMLGVGPGDEVICSSFTFSASANPIVYQGAKPVFVDSEAKTWNMDPTLLEQAIEDRIKVTGQKPKAIIVVHLYGVPADLTRIVSISNHYGIPLIEDAAESLGSLFRGKQTGTFGAFGVYSFNGNKIITTSGGGALVAKEREHIARARFLSTQARDNAPHYQHSSIGYNYRLSNVCAGIGRGQLKVLDKWIELRRKNFEFYVENLSDLPGVSFLKEPPGCYSNRWLTTITIDSSASKGITRETIRLALEKENIESRPLWKPMHLQPVFEGAPAYTNGTSEKLFDTGLCLPSGSNLTEKDLKRIVDVIRKAF
jgi:dTDP-4-amino-4,6-dideoxygalactose transaminase